MILEMPRLRQLLAGPPAALPARFARSPTSSKTFENCDEYFKHAVQYFGNHKLNEKI